MATAGVETFTLSTPADGSEHVVTTIALSPVPATTTFEVVWIARDTVTPSTGASGRWTETWTHAPSAARLSSAKIYGPAGNPSVDFNGLDGDNIQLRVVGNGTNPMEWTLYVYIYPSIV